MVAPGGIEESENEWGKDHMGGGRKCVRMRVKARRTTEVSVSGNEGDNENEPDNEDIKAPKI